jgi:hypothetical protein
MRGILNTLEAAYALKSYNKSKLWFLDNKKCRYKKIKYPYHDFLLSQLLL